MKHTAITDAASLFNGILAGIAQQPEQLRRAAYVSALRSMDWDHEFSDDHRVYSAGRARLLWLQDEQRAIDPDGAIARATAPAGRLSMLGGAVMRTYRDLHTPQEGAAIQVLWARLGTKAEPGDVWCDGEFVRAIGVGPGRQYLVRSATPRTPHPMVRPVAPESVRLVAVQP